jgi:hypothetical protein
MSWRIDENPQVHSDGILPNCFEVYSSKEELRSSLLRIHSLYDLENTPKIVFSTFIEYYPHFYYGDISMLKNTLDQFSNQ